SQRAPGLLGRHHAHEIGAEHRGQDDRGIARIGEVVHGPGPDLAPGDARIQSLAGPGRIRVRVQLGGRGRTLLHACSAAIPARAIATSSLDLTPDTPTAPTIWPSTVMGTPPSSMPFKPGADRNAVRP